MMNLQNDVGRSRWFCGQNLFFLVLTCLVLASGARSASADKGEARPLFRSDQQIAITIKAPLNRLIRRAHTSVEEYPGTLSYVGDDGVERVFAITLRARGNTRRDKAACKFPPLKVALRKADVKNTLFHKQSQLKLVTHCKGGKYEQLYHKEYLAYRLYNFVTPASFLVRPLSVTYVDEEGRRSTETKFGFFIEDVDDMAKRNGSVELNITETKSSRLDPKTATTFAIFQYMIGNLDWSAVKPPIGKECCHNSKLIGDKGAEAAAGAGVFPVPYDFDQAGLVDAPYALPPLGLGIKKVTKRLYRGFCRHNGMVPEVIEDFQGAEIAMMDLIASYDGLSKSSRKKSTKFMSQFFEVIGYPKSVERNIFGKCRGKRKVK